MALARMATGNLAIVPASVQIGDFIFCSRFKLRSGLETTAYVREPFLLRPTAETWRPGVHEMIYERLGTNQYVNTPGQELAPIVHCTLLGGCFVERSPMYQAVPHVPNAEKSPRSRWWKREHKARAVEGPIFPKPKLGPATIFAIH